MAKELLERLQDVKRITKAYIDPDQSIGNAIHNMDTSKSFYEICDHLGIQYRKIGSGFWSKVFTGNEGEFVVKITDNTHGYEDPFEYYAEVADMKHRNHLFPTIHFKKKFKDDTSIYILDNLDFSLSGKIFAAIAYRNDAMSEYALNAGLNSWLETGDEHAFRRYKERFFFSGAIEKHELIDDWFNTMRSLMLEKEAFFDIKADNLALNSQRKLVITDPLK